MCPLSSPLSSTTQDADQIHRLLLSLVDRLEVAALQACRRHSERGGPCQRVHGHYIVELFLINNLNCLLALAHTLGWMLLGESLINWRLSPGMS